MNIRLPFPLALLLATPLWPVSAVAADVSAEAITAEGTRRALLIGISHYSGNDGGWADLASDNDLAAIRSSLLRWGFAASNVTELTEDAATREGILSALDTLAAAAQPGDHIVVHYSGHGQQIADDSGDEADGYDEAIVAWGAPMNPPDGYTGAAHLRDDDFGVEIDALRTTVGPAGSVVVFLDSCHSGTASRGGVVVRSGQPIGVAQRATSAPAVGGDFVGEAASGAEGLGRLVVLSAARADQVAQEVANPDGTHHGAFTAALVATLSSAQQMPSWAAVYERVRAEMARTVIGQTPQIEGDRDTGLFGGRDQRPDAFFLVSTSLSATRFQVDGGELHGLFPGSVVSVQRSGTSRAAPETQVGEGTVVDARATTATVELSAPVAADELGSARVFVTKWDLGDQRLAVRIDLGARGLNHEWRAAVNASPLRFVDMRAPDVTLQRAGGSIVLVDASDPARILAEGFAAEPEGATTVVAGLAEAARTHLLRAIDLAGERYRIEARLVPSAVGPDGHCTPADSSKSFDRGGALEVHSGEAFQIEVRNVGVTDAWLTVVGVDTSDHARQLLPAPGLPPERLAAGGAWWRPGLCREASAPFGTEELRFFATRNPLDLGPILGWADVSARGGTSDPLQMLVNSLGNGTRGSKPPSTEQDGFTTEIVYTIAE